MNCACHDEPAYWQKHPRYKAGGFWRCAVNKRGYQRDRYDEDFIHRVEKGMNDNARRRRETIERRRTPSLGIAPKTRSTFAGTASEDASRASSTPRSPSGAKPR